MILSTHARDSPSVFRARRPNAHNCVMQWCVKTINASFADGCLQEQVQSFFLNDTELSNPLVIIRSNDTFEYTYTRDIVIRKTATDETFMVSNVSALSSRYAMDNWAPLFLTKANASTSQIVRYQNWGSYQLGMKNVDATWIASGSTPKAMEDMATAMTTALRNKKRNTENVLGSGSPEVFIEVRWDWLSFPLCVFGLSTLFLVTTACQISHQERTWKSSSLTSLVHGLDPDVRSCLAKARNMKEMRKAASQLHVHLDSGGNMRSLKTAQENEAEIDWTHTFLEQYLRHR